MSRYIEVDMLKRILTGTLEGLKKSPKLTGQEMHLIAGFDALLETVDEMPTEDVAPINHGHWCGESDGYADGYPVCDVWYCSECGECIEIDNPNVYEHSYCSYCGSKMAATDTNVGNKEATE